MEETIATIKILIFSGLGVLFLYKFVTHLTSAFVYHDEALSDAKRVEHYTKKETEHGQEAVAYFVSLFILVVVFLLDWFLL